jgi:hypothetical protein
VAGVVALLLQAADHPLSIEEIRAAILGHARHNPPAAGLNWHPVSVIRIAPP